MSSLMIAILYPCPSTDLHNIYSIELLRFKGFSDKESIKKGLTRIFPAYTTSNNSPIGLNSAVSWRFSFDLISSNRWTVSWE